MLPVVSEPEVVLLRRALERIRYVVDPDTQISDLTRRTRAWTLANDALNELDRTLKNVERDEGAA